MNTHHQHDHNGNIMYIKETAESGNIHERWYIVTIPIMGSMLDNLMIGRYTYSDGRVLYFDKKGTQTTKEKWERTQRKITMNHSEDGVCPFCSKKTDSLSANPSEWAVTLPIDGNGKTNKCHVGCVMQKINAAKDKPVVLTPQPISTAPKDGTPILVWCEDEEWNAWVTAKWIDGSWYGDHDCSWKGNNLDVRTPNWWLPMPPEPTKMLNGIVVNKGKAVPPKYELEEE